MKKKLRTWLAGVSSAFPTAFSPYWRVLPLGRMRMLLAGYFFVGAAGGSYASKRVIYSLRDLFLMVTDGITEVANARDEEFGLTRLQELLTQTATRALPEIWDLIMREALQYGLQQDDQSLLLLRLLDPASPIAA